MQRILTALLCCLVLIQPALAARAKFAGPCFTVHGRLVQSNGDPDLRLWRVGTRRVLGVFDCAGNDENPHALPANVRKLAGDYVETPVFGDYRVCPFTRPRPGWMQMVCIKAASHLVRDKSD